MSKHRPRQRSFYDLYYYTPPWIYAIPVLVGIVFATLLGIAAGWEGVVGGVAMGLFLGALYAGGHLLVRWAIRQRNRQD